MRAFSVSSYLVQSIRGLFITKKFENNSYNYDSQRALSIFLTPYMYLYFTGWTKSMRKCTTSRRISGTISSSTELPTKRGRHSRNCFKRRQNYFQNSHMMRMICVNDKMGNINKCLKTEYDQNKTQ